jgi:DNA/RNA endonuclease G (NUC1)
VRKYFVALLFAASLAPTSATIDALLQMQLGNPSNATANTNNHSHHLIQRPVHAFDFNDSNGVPNWVSWNLTASDIGSSGRSPNFYVDTNLPPNFIWVGTGDYSGSGYDRGHMCPSADRTDHASNNVAVFFMSNIIPQAPENNQGVWAQFEGYCRTLAQSGNEVLITCGPSGFSGTRLPSGHVAIPSNIWKTIVVVPAGAGTALSRLTISNRVISIRIPNTSTVTTPWQQYITTTRQIELETGFNFFNAVPPTIASAYRARIDGLTNAPAPSISSFSPISGLVNSSVTITGTNFNSASIVSFNVTDAVFLVDSTTQITATVPAGATAGPITITTPGGTAISATDFTVGIVFAPDLAVSSTHTNIFTQGDFGRTLTITVTNAGNASATGPVTLTNMLPAGLAITATRADSLVATSSYPAITITVNVASNTPAMITNTVIISGGGDTSPGNNTASDIIPVNSLAGVPFTLAGWDVSSQSTNGVSPLPPVNISLNVAVGGLTRGPGVSTSGSGVARGWGGNNWTNTSSAAAIAANQFVTFSVAGNFGYEISFTSLNKFDYRRSATGPTNGLLQYRLGAGAFVDIATFTYTSSSSSGGSIAPMDLAGVAALQNISWTTNVTFRIVNWGGTSAAGTWYVFDVANSPAVDLAVQGTLLYTIPPPADITSQPQSRTNNVGEDATFTVAASGPGNLRYQWLFNAANISGATNTSFILSNVQPANAGIYSVEVFNGSLSTSSNATLTVNHLPVTVADVFNRLPETALTIPISIMLANDTDVDADTLMLSGLSEASTNGALMDHDDFFIFYTPAVTNGNVPDQFTYTVSDGRGGTATGIVTVRVVHPLNLTGSLNGGSFMLTAAEGVAGATYWLQSATNLTMPNSWVTIVTNVPTTNGPLQFIDPVALNDLMRFYRTVTP